MKQVLRLVASVKGHLGQIWCFGQALSAAAKAGRIESEKSYSISKDYPFKYQKGHLFGIQELFRTFRVSTSLDFTFTDYTRATIRAESSNTALEARDEESIRISYFVHRSRYFGCHMRSAIIRKREQFQEFTHTLFILGDVGIIFSVWSLHVNLRNYTSPSMSWRSRDLNHV